VKEELSVARSMVTFVTKKPKVLAMYRTHKDLKLVKFSATHYDMIFIVVRTIIEGS
jgi:hypothetical protein